MPGFSVVNSSESPDSNPLSKFPFDVKPDVQSLKKLSQYFAILERVTWNKSNKL